MRVRGVGGEGVAKPDLGLLVVAGGECGADGGLVVADAGGGHVLRLVNEDSLVRLARLRVSDGEGFDGGRIVREGVRGGIEDGERAAGVADGGCLVGAAHGPVGPDGLDGLALVGSEVGDGCLGSSTGGRGSAILHAIVERPGVLDLDVGGRGFALRGVVLLDAIEVGSGFAGTAEGLIDRGGGLQVGGDWFRAGRARRGDGR